MTSDGKPFSQERYRQLVQERFLISKHTHTSYNDAGKLHPTERALILKFIVEDLETQKNIIENQRNTN